jgi:hypothetical protein
MLSTLLKQAVKDLLDNTVFPKLKAYEAQIGNTELQSLIEQITTDAQTFVDNLLT